jgi:hypothetical protein
MPYEYVNISLPSSGPKIMEVIHPSEISLDMWTTQCCTPEEGNILAILVCSVKNQSVISHNQLMDSKCYIFAVL